jgi:hypothetical protein
MVEAAGVEVSGHFVRLLPTNKLWTAEESGAAVAAAGQHRKKHPGWPQYLENPAKPHNFQHNG